MAMSALSITHPDSRVYTNIHSGFVRMRSLPSVNRAQSIKSMS